MKEDKLVKSGQENLAENTRLFERVREILDAAKSNVARSVNTEMVRAYWLIGQAIVEDEQQGAERAGYGEHVIQSLSARLKAEGLKGFGRRNLAWMREFYLKFQNLHALRAELSWTHYRLLLKVESDAAREFYETESVAGNWSTRELERQKIRFSLNAPARQSKNEKCSKRADRPKINTKRRILSKIRLCWNF